MKKICLIASIFLFAFMFKANVFATCTSEEESTLKSEASKVSASYEMSQDTIDVDGSDGGFTMDLFVIHVDNLTEDLYAVITNDYPIANDGYDTVTINYNDTTGGSGSFSVEQSRYIVNFTIDIYSSSKTNCPDTLLYETTVKTPMQNWYANYTVCDGIEDYYLCQEYITEDIDFDSINFFDQVEKYRESIGLNDEEVAEEAEEQEENNNFFKEHKTVIIVGAVILAIVIVLVVIIVIKRKGSRKNEKI